MPTRRLRAFTRTSAAIAAVLLTAGGSLTPAAVAQTTADPGWPRVYTTPAGARLRIYQPQIASWDGQKHLVAYVAVAHTASGDQQPVLGTLKVEAETTVAITERLVNFAALRIAETNFGSVGRERVRAIVRDVELALPAFERVISLDRVLAGLDRSQIRATNVEGVKADPPAIFFSTRPAVLVAFDGRPIWSPIKDNDLRYAVNTNWDIFEHVPSKMLFLRIDEDWLQSPAVNGPWTRASRLPDSFNRLPPDQNWKDVVASLHRRTPSSGAAPAVFVSTAPAELILLRGAPSYVLVANSSDLLWVSNTDSDVFRLGRNGTVYYLVAGRWFSAPDFDGPWTFATPSLPRDFVRINAEHPRARVLASVPGTPQATEAVVLAQIPQTAKVHKATTEAPHVAYVGEPRFETIERTSLQHAVNTSSDVIKLGDRYYLCVKGVWFVANTPKGPWIVTSVVPPAIYSIPVSSPLHHVTYVSVVETSTDWVTFAAASGYTGVTIAWGCAVWGTGWYYPPYTYYGGYYPVYFPYYPTYGYAARYNPWTAVYERGAVAYGPYGGVGAAARYDPVSGTYARGAMAWGPYGATGAVQAYNPRTETYAQTRQASGVYGSWGSASVQRGDDWAHTARATNNVSGATTRATRTDDGGIVSRNGPNGSGFVAAGEEGVYAGRDGNVYRRGEDGWQKYENGAWGSVERPGAADGTRERPNSGSTPPDRSTIGQLDRDRAARIEGGQRARGERGGNARGGGSARPRARGGRGR
jgi:hypothetical protein